MKRINLVGGVRVRANLVRWTFMPQQPRTRLKCIPKCSPMGSPQNEY